MDYSYAIFYRISIVPIFQNYAQVIQVYGKETVQTLSYGNSKGKMASTSVNKQSVGKELMSRINVEQMSNAMCLVFIRALKPFKVHKFKLEEHPNYRYTAEANKKYLFKNPFILKYDDEEIEEALKFLPLTPAELMELWQKVRQ